MRISPSCHRPLFALSVLGGNQVARGVGAVQDIAKFGRPSLNGTDKIADFVDAVDTATELGGFGE